MEFKIDNTKYNFTVSNGVMRVLLYVDNVDHMYQDYYRLKNGESLENLISEELIRNSEIEVITKPDVILIKVSDTLDFTLCPVFEHQLRQNL